MVNKPKFWRRLILGIMIGLGTLAVAVVAVPPMITLNSLRPKIEYVIAQRTGVAAKIRGNVHFSLIGGAMISAHDIVVPGGTVASTRVRIPLTSIFDLANAPLNGDIVVYGARLTIDKLVPVAFENKIEIHDSFINFYDKVYEILSAEILGSTLRGTVRTNQHKYEIDSVGDEFIVKNRANDLLITGHLYSDGSAQGTMNLASADINAWFEFDTPKIDEPVKLSMDFDWDGGYGFNFTHIRGDNFSGAVRLYPDGARDIQLQATDVDLDFSFLSDGTDLLRHTSVDLILGGNLKFWGHQFHRLVAQVQGKDDVITIQNIILDDIRMTGGTIRADGARNIFIQMPLDGRAASCMFSGTPTDWQCSQFTWGTLSGRIAVKENQVEVFIQSPDAAPDMTWVVQQMRRLGNQGTITFQFSDIAGTMEITPKNENTHYTFARNRTLDWARLDMNFLPDFMRQAPGDFSWGNQKMHFTPYNGRWQLTVDGHWFEIQGKNFREWIPGMDTGFLNDMDYQVSGIYNGHDISDLVVRIGTHEFTGSVSGQTITLSTPVLNVDAFTRQSFIDQFEELEFLVPSPLVAPFGFAARVSLSAQQMIYNGHIYQNVVYALKPDVQTISISDQAQGNLLVRMTRDKKTYALSILLNQFRLNGALLGPQMPINIQDSALTGTAEIKTSGQIAYDFRHNIQATLDLTFIGGYLSGLGFDAFYAAAPNMSTLNAEWALAAALDGGQTRLKQLHLVGKYDAGHFETTRPLTLALPHVDAQGDISIRDGQLTATLDMILRGTSPSPAPVQLTISGNRRDYSLSEIMIGFDPEYMRDFVRNHNKF